MNSNPQFSDFAVMARAGWVRVVDRVMPPGYDSFSWSNPSEISCVLNHLAGSSFARALLPTGGTIDVSSASYSNEAGCVEFHSGERSVIVVQPASLKLERIASNVAESFALLDLRNLQPTGVYEHRREQHMINLRCEEVVDLGCANYVSRDGRDDGVYEDEFGDEHELPDNYRAVSRFLSGKLMLVARGSIWCRHPGLDGGFHENMDASSIRWMCESIINR